LKRIDGLLDAVEGSDQVFGHRNLGHGWTEHVEHFIKVVFRALAAMNLAVLPGNLVESHDVGQVFSFELAHGSANGFPIHVQSELLKHFIENDDRPLNCQAVVIRIEMA
jgi:hypothetical protein